MGILDEIKQSYKQGGALIKLIYINIAVFIVTLLLGSFSGLFESKPDFIGDWFALSSSFEIWITRPWTIVTYGFFHGGFMHILFNLLWLYIFGRLFLDYFTPKQLLNFSLSSFTISAISKYVFLFKRSENSYKKS